MQSIRRNLASCVAALLLASPLAAQIPLAPGVHRAHPDHYEFDAALHAPFLGERGEARTVKMAFDFVNAETGTMASWRLEAVDAKGVVRRAWHGETFLTGGKGVHALAWDGSDTAGRALERGFYTLRLTAKAMAREAYRHYPGGSQMDRVEAHLAAGAEETAHQETVVCMGPAPRLQVRPVALASAVRPAPVAPGAAPAPAALPFTVYFGNLHSQTNHSDGGVVVANCTGGENPQSGTQGPAEAYQMMRVSAGGDFLAATEHNHMYDGSTGTGNVDPAIPIALFDSGIAAATAYNSANPSFVALYGVEWGVISNGGHLNIFNPDGLPTWERNLAGQLMGEVDTPKSQYPELYTTMRARGWVGQFNHPQLSQFNNLAYTADGDEVMALCEVSNSGAFSISLTESDPFLSDYELAYKAILERGFHVAPTSNQDNHCANWGLSNRNRTGVLIPTGTPWSPAALMDAIRARRTFATHDKGSQIVLTTAGGAVMGDRISNSGSLTLQVHYATTTPGRSVSRIQIFEGVPGTPFSTVQMLEGTDTATFTPAAGNHYYYAKITQDDGRFLWSAPIWVNQAAGPVAANVSVPSVNTTVQDGAVVNFTGSATTTNGSITGHGWNFGDGQTATGQSTSHAFSNPGPGNLVRTVTYTATDNLGFTGQGTRLITVTPAGVSNTNPTISDIPNQSTLKDTPITSLGFTIGDAETNANLLTVAANSSNQTLLPNANITFGGGGTGRTITLTPAPDQTGTATVTVTVTDAAGATATDTFLLSVSVAGGPAGKVILTQYYEGAGNDKYIEITNVGGTPVDLASPQLFLALFNNAAADFPSTSAPNSTQSLTGTLNAGASLVFRSNATSNPGPPVLPTYAATNPAVIPTAVCGFNGDDLVILTTSNSTTVGVAWSARLDVVGDGTSWGTDRSYYRNATVVNPNATFNLAGEWTLAGATAAASLTNVQNATNTLTEYLGTHTFNSPAAISDIPGQTIEANQQAGPIAFTVGGTPTLTVTATSGNVTLLANAGIVLGGSGTARTITCTPVADQVGTALVTVTVTDGAATTATDTFVLSVTDPVSTITGVTVAPDNPTVNGLSTTTFTATVTGTGSFSQAVNWTATGGTINALGQWTAPNTAGPFTITATSVQDATKSDSTSVTVIPVNTNPTVSDIADQNATAGVLLGPIAFTVGDLETAAASLTVGGTSNNQTLLPDASITFGGSGASRNLSLTPAANQFGTVTVTVTVTDGAGATATDTFVVTVAPPPSKVIISQYYEGATGTNKWLEITNTGTTAVNLASPQLYVAGFQNANADNPAGTAPNGTFTLTGTLNPGQSLVLRNSASTLPPYAVAGSVVATNVTQFNGDDLVVLTLSSSATPGVAWSGRVDLVGNGDSWGADKSFHRKPAVMLGNRTFSFDATGATGEWQPRTLAEADAGNIAFSEFLGIHYFGTAPSVSDMGNLTVTVNQAIPGIPFTVGDAETPLDNLAFTFASSNATLLPVSGISVSGTGASRTLNLAPAANQLGAATVTVTVKDHGNLTATDSFLLTVNDVPPSSLTYNPNPAVYVKDLAIAPNAPSHSGGAVISWSVSPALPSGLSLNPATGVITGTPTVAQAATTYTVTATNSGGSTTVGLSIAVNLRTRSSITYSLNPATYTRGAAIVPNTPQNVPAGFTSFTVSSALPAGLAMNPATGVITGTPTLVTPTASYTVAANGAGASMLVNLVITVREMAPSGLIYSQNPAVYTKGTPIAANLPASAGGPIAAYSVAPALPAGLVLDGVTGIITGTPLAVTPAAAYTVTGTNSGGSVSVALTLAVIDVAPSGLSYSLNPATYEAGSAITPNVPTYGGGTITSFTVFPALPAGLGLNPLTGVISGTPTSATAMTGYTITGSNSGGSVVVVVNLEVTGTIERK